MPYCITLRSRTDRSITAWHDGSKSGWSTDHERQKLFDKKRDAKPVRHQLRKLCPRNANVINIEPPILRSELARAILPDFGEVKEFLLPSTRLRTPAASWMGRPLC